MKNTLVVTHERSGTHLVINIINYENYGNFKPIGKLPKFEKKYNLETYIEYANLSLLYESYQPKLIFKSHHQIDFFKNNLKELFNKYYVIYVKRDIKDVLISYYKFLNAKGKDSNGKSIPIKGFPEFKDWIFMKPCDVGYKYFEKYPDPHIYNEPDTYIDRYMNHYSGWMEYKENLLLINYEDIINNFIEVKYKLEKFLNKEVSDILPDIKNKKFPNFAPNKGIVGYHKEFMDNDLIEKINNYISLKYLKCVPSM